MRRERLEVCGRWESNERMLHVARKRCDKPRSSDSGLKKAGMGAKMPGVKGRECDAPFAPLVLWPFTPFGAMSGGAVCRERRRGGPLQTNGRARGALKRRSSTRTEEFLRAAAGGRCRWCEGRPSRRRS